MINISKIYKQKAGYFFNRFKIQILMIQRLLSRQYVIARKHICKYPKTIQLPITYKCNFDCKMCGMRNLINNKDYSNKELEKILEDKLFSKVNSVGLNGGEPFLREDLIECVEIMIRKMPKLKSFYIISNGYFTDLIKEKLSMIYAICKSNKIAVNLSFSIDGIQNTQDFMRGHKNAWKNVITTIEEIKKNQQKYCDGLGIICTITKYNVFNLEELDFWAKKNNLPIRYNIATLNARIANENKYEDFTIFSDEATRFAAQEFFYKKAMQECSEAYFGLFLYINEKKRYAICPCQYNEWVTLVPNGNISYCATYSQELGSALTNSAYDLFNSNLGILSIIREQHCGTCSHYISQLNVSGLKLLKKELLKNQYVMF